MPLGKEERRIVGILVRVTPERRQAIFDEIDHLSTASQSFFMMVSASTIIAAYGLLANSTAVIIGAMLVAPLMGPIFGVALALTIGNQRLLGRALLSELAGMLLVILLAMLIGLVPVRLGFGSEILARTQPTVYDLVIALASGIAGAYAMIDERLNAALPGVAISTALVPPLATCGLALAAMRWDWAMGAFLLFLANFLAIHVVAALVFSLFGIKNIRVKEVAGFFKRFGFSLLALAVVSVFLTQTLVDLWKKWQFSTELQEVLSYQVRSRAGAQLSEVKSAERQGKIEVLATVLTPNAFEPNEVAQIEKVLRQRVNPQIHLILRSLISKDYDLAGPVYVPKEELEQRSKVAEHTAFLKEASHSLRRQLTKFPGAQLMEVQLEPLKDETRITAMVFSPEVIEPGQVADIEKTLKQDLKKPLHLVVRSILTRDATCDNYLFELDKAPTPLTGEALKLHQQLEKALKNQIQANLEGAHLEEFQYARRHDRLLLLAVVRTPQNVGAAQVSRLQEALRTQVDPSIDLVVRSVVGVDTSDAGYVPNFDERQLLPQTAADAVQ